VSTHDTISLSKLQSLAKCHNENVSKAVCFANYSFSRDGGRDRIPEEEREYLDKRLLNPLNPELNPICCLLALLGANHFLHVNRIRVKSLTLRLLMSYTYGEDNLQRATHKLNQIITEYVMRFLLGIPPASEC